jgi:hypothetical protein
LVGSKEEVNKLELQEPTCPHGYTEDDLTEILGEDGLVPFWNWMSGQTVMLCDGRKYNHTMGEYVETSCSATPHGVVVYEWDLERFMLGLPVVD